MNKKILSFFVLSCLFLSSCGGNTKTTITADNPPDISSEPDKVTVCSDICQNKVQNLCQEEIASNKTVGTSMENSILDEANCQLMCEADFDESIYDCFLGADSCSQFLDKAPYCLETEGDEIEIKDGNGCETACNNYSKCTRYTQGTTQEDWQDAKESCMQICPSWSSETKKCVASTEINSVIDCSAQTQCVVGKLK
ncbi:MAG: hypothetical protein PHN31_05065 [Candidatus Gracilibacteria bacterium]|nr:hypothetical protein [Candidatus Gracilibacteria bacterium]